MQTEQQTGAPLITYVALLRGINVSGQKKITMPDLQKLVGALGHADVSTYIQSGNVIFRSSATNPAGVAIGIEEAIERDLGFTVTVVLRTRDELGHVIETNPFLRPGIDLAHLHVTFLTNLPTSAVLSSLNVQTVGPDEFRALGREIYLHCPQGYGRTKLNNAFWERRLHIAATTRNWNTVTRLFQLAGG